MSQKKAQHIKKIINSNKMQKGQRRLYFLDGSYWIVKEDACRGCLSDKQESELPIHLKPIFKDKDICVRQDVEFSVPAFYIVSTAKHIPTLADIPNDILYKIIIITKKIRKIMGAKLGVEHANIYHEERLKNSHYHQWILPIWSKKVSACGYIPKIYQSNVKKYAKYEANIHKYLKSFKFKEESSMILKCNRIVSKSLQKDREIQKFS